MKVAIIGTGNMASGLASTLAGARTKSSVAATRPKPQHSLNKSGRVCKVAALQQPPSWPTS
jgi:3-hydroxyisobutyrate dehydrogenase-like beta-hydroxyacid dehydrogenase